jgi:cell pole-organizing protein PopZ
MEDILASIRRILSEDEAPSNSAAVPPHPPADVLALDASMMVEENEPAREDPVQVSPVPAAEHPARNDPDATVSPIARAAISPPPTERLPSSAPIARPMPPVATPTNVSPVSSIARDALVAPEAAAAAASSVGSLLHKLAEQRAMPVYRNGPTLEDIVREEIRPMLKEWLDTHIPEIVERLVRAEIERVVNSAMR